jgi:hypothetical protein
VLLDEQSVVKSVKQKLSANPLPRKRLRTSCQIEWGIVRKIIADKNILQKTRRIKGHAGITGNELAALGAKTTSSPLQLGIISQTHFLTAVTQAIDITPIYMN